MGRGIKVRVRAGWKSDQLAVCSRAHFNPCSLLLAPLRSLSTKNPKSCPTFALQKSAPPHFPTCTISERWDVPGFQQETLVGQPQHSQTRRVVRLFERQQVHHSASAGQHSPPAEQRLLRRSFRRLQHSQSDVVGKQRPPPRWPSVPLLPPRTLWRKSATFSDSPRHFHRHFRGRNPPPVAVFRPAADGQQSPAEQQQLLRPPRQRQRRSRTLFHLRRPADAQLARLAVGPPPPRDKFARQSGSFFHSSADGWAPEPVQQPQRLRFRVDASAEHQQRFQRPQTATEGSRSSGDEETSSGGQRSWTQADEQPEQRLRPSSRRCARSRQRPTTLQVRNASNGSELHYRAVGIASVRATGPLCFCSYSLPYCPLPNIVFSSHKVRPLSNVSNDDVKYLIIHCILPLKCPSV